LAGRVLGRVVGFLFGFPDTGRVLGFLFTGLVAGLPVGFFTGLVVGLFAGLVEGLLLGLFAGLVDGRVFLLGLLETGRVDFGLLTAGRLLLGKFPPW
jgi:hypothetical protein